jgi:hypothetical protein
MLRASLLAKSGRVCVGRFGVYRNFCKEKSPIAKLHDKFYIVNVKNEQSALVTAQQPPTKALADGSIKGDHWHRLQLVLEEIFYIYRNQLSRKMKDLQVDERVLEMKKRHAEKLTSALTQENVKKIMGAAQIQLKAIKDSKVYERVQKLPALTNEVVAKGNHYWILFNESKYKELIIYYAKMGQKGVIEVLKFVKHVYKAPSK